MERLRKILQNIWVVSAVIFLGLTARMWVATLGHNYDMDSWYIAADIARHGGNVYAETTRYNYGPAWFQIIHLLDVLAGHQREVLRYLITGLLSLVDVGLFLFLSRRFGPVAGVLYFLNPISIIVTGYHCQFDNLAILLGLLSMQWLGDNFDQPVNGRKFAGLLLLGLSLIVKHLFFVFPFWLAVKQKGFVQKIIILVVPIACFLLSFSPYWAGGREGIMQNVFGFNDYLTEYFYQSCVPLVIQSHCDSRGIWHVLLIVFAFVCRKRNGFESLLVYTGVLVAFSPRTVNEYFAIPVALVAVFPSVPFALFTALATFHLFADHVNGLPLWPGQHRTDMDRWAIITLAFALVWLVWRPQWVRLIRTICQEVELQFGRPGRNEP
jgi:hypothetical protein